MNVEEETYLKHILITQTILSLLSSAHCFSSKMFLCVTGLTLTCGPAFSSSAQGYAFQPHLYVFLLCYSLELLEST